MTSNHAIKTYSFRDIDYYMEHIPDTIIKKLNEEEYVKLKELISSAIPQPAPKLIDLRFVINLIVVKYFFVLFIGTDRYKKRKRSQDPQLPRHIRSLRKFAHITTAVVLFLIINLMISVCMIAITYLTARLLGFHPLV